MIEARASRTAVRVAMRRAAHQLVDRPLVLDDPVALPILGAELGERVRREIAAQNGRVARSVRAFMVARARLAEDALAAAVARGVRRYVVLGAGLDTFAYRNPFPEVHVVEVDHPATQEWKRRKLAAARIPIPETLRFAPVDFERQTLAEGLAAAGLDRAEPTFFSWLGVTMYLTREAFTATLATIGDTAPGGGLALDYALPKSALGWRGRWALAALSRRVAAAGEPFVSFFSPAEIGELLAGSGLAVVEDLDRAAVNARYFAGRDDRLEISGSLARLLVAERC